MWRSVLLHEFPDDDIRSLQGLEGSLTPVTLALNPHGGAVQISPGRGFEYSLVQPLDEIVGVSGRVRLRYPIQGVVSPVSIVRIGDMVELMLQPSIFDAGFNPADLAAPAMALLRIGSTEAELGSIMLPHRRFVDIRFDWHSSGQAMLRLDGQPAGYQNALSPGLRLTIPSIRFGLLNLDETRTNPRYEVGRLFVRALARPDALAGLSRVLPRLDIPDDELLERCRMRTTVNLMAKVDRLRAFMSQVHQVLSQPWSRAGGPPEGPFSIDATAAHRLANEATVALWEMLRSGDFSQPDRFLDPFTRFLEILHRTLPAEFEQLASELRDTPAIPDECRAILEQALEPGHNEFEPLLGLLSEASTRIDQIVGGI